MRFLFAALLILATAGCSLIYRLPTNQGNVIEQDKIDQLKVGMTHAQVQYLLGTPLAASPFDKHRWDYVGYYRSPRGDVSERKVQLFFDGDRLVRIKGAHVAANDKALKMPDAQALSEQEKRDLYKESRETDQADHSSGVSIAPPQR